TTSPPRPGNFHRLPTVHSRTPLWEPSSSRPPVVTGLSTTEREILVTTAQDAIPHHRFHISDEAPWPFLTALVTGSAFIGFIFTPWSPVMGAVIALFVVAAWFW